jgi:hypothetical protein
VLTVARAFSEADHGIVATRSKAHGDKKIRDPPISLIPDLHRFPCCASQGSCDLASMTCEYASFVAATHFVIACRIDSNKLPLLRVIINTEIGAARTTVAMNRTDAGGVVHTEYKTQACRLRSDDSAPAKNSILHRR